MSRRDNWPSRCPRCRVHEGLCFCALLPRLETRTRVVLLIHCYEDRKPTNTGRLAAECLPNSEVIVRGQASRTNAPLTWDPASQPLLLYPHEQAVPIAQLTRSERPLTLIVPDGNWRHAAKVRKRVPGLRDVPIVSLPLDQPSTYRLRTQPREDGLSTIEAIARALEILEGPHVREGLELAFRAMVERSLWSRGQFDTAAVTGGIPAGAQRHDPRSGRAARSDSPLPSKQLLRGLRA